MVILLFVNVALQRRQMRWAGRKGAVSALPVEGRRFLELGFDPDRRTLFELFDEQLDLTAS